MNWFGNTGSAYARFRPQYPAELAEILAALAPTLNLAVDVGCGTGQLTVQLAQFFASVIGIDPSADQLANAPAHPRVRFVRAPAEHLPVGGASTALITAAQAAHWFDLAAFCREVRRVGEPGAIIALVSYGVPDLGDDLGPLFQQFYRGEIGPYWPPERALVDDGYRGLSFPFDEVEVTPLQIREALTLTEFLGYLSTWSATRAAADAGREDILATFEQALTDSWGNPDTARDVSWPINTRVGRVCGYPPTGMR